MYYCEYHLENRLAGSGEWPGLTRRPKSEAMSHLLLSLHRQAGNIPFALGFPGAAVYVREDLDSAPEYVRRRVDPLGLASAEQREEAGFRPPKAVNSGDNHLGSVVQVFASEREELECLLESLCCEATPEITQARSPRRVPRQKIMGSVAAIRLRWPRQQLRNNERVDQIWLRSTPKISAQSGSTAQRFVLNVLPCLLTEPSETFVPRSSYGLSTGGVPIVQPVGMPVPDRI